MVNFSLILFFFPLLAQAKPLVSRATQNPNICDAGCSKSNCARDTYQFGQVEDSLPLGLFKRHLDSAKDLDEQTSHYVLNRIEAKSEKGGGQDLNWHYNTVDVVSINGTFKVSANSNTKDDVDNMRAWVQGLIGYENSPTLRFPIHSLCYRCTGIAVVSEKGQ